MVSATQLKVERAATIRRLQGALTKSIAERRPRVVQGPLSSMLLNIPVLSIAMVAALLQVLSRNAVLPVAELSTILGVPTLTRLLGKRSVVFKRKRARVVLSTRHLLQGEGALLLVAAPLTTLNSLRGSFTLRERSAIALTIVREGMAGALSSGAIPRSTRGSLSRMIL